MEEQQAPPAEGAKPAGGRKALWIVVAVIVVVLVAVVGAGFSGLLGGERPQAIFYPSYTGAGDKIIPVWWQNRQNWPAEWLYSEGLKASEFFRRLANASVDLSTIEGTAPTTSNDPAILASNALFAADYEAEYGTEPNVFDPHSYDAVFVLALAFQKSQTTDTNASAFKQALRDVSNPPGTMIRPGNWTEAKAAIDADTDIDYVGASGTLNFDEFGDVGSDYEVYTVNTDGTQEQKLFIPENSWVEGSSAAPSVRALSVPDDPEPRQVGEIKIGTLLDRTGQLADFGWDMENATDLARDQINAQGGITIDTTEYTIRTIHEDDGTNVDRVTQSATKLVNTDQVDAVVGATGSGISIAAFNIIRPAGIIQMSASSTSAALTPASFDPTDQFWRTAPPDQLQGAAAAWYAYEERGWRVMSMTYVDNAYGRGLADVFEQEFEARGGKILRSVPHSDQEAAVDANSVLQTLFTPVSFFTPGKPFIPTAVSLGRETEGL